MTGHDVVTGEGAGETAYEPFMGREVRVGPLTELAKGTYRVAVERVAEGRGEAAAELLEIAVREAEEAYEIYGIWPAVTLDWMREQGATNTEIEPRLARLRSLVGDDAMDGLSAGWQEYLAATAAAVDACRRGDPQAAALIEATRAIWQRTHDGAMDHMYGVIDIAVRVVGESRLGDLWNVLMADWYDAHEQRLDIRRQPWSESARQLQVAILDGFHAHLTGPERQGDVEIIEEADRLGFRFAPCGSGGRTMSEQAGHPRTAPPFNFAVTEDEHDWAWNTRGICAYCVHCCLLNELIPIDRLGYPTRVIDPPTWPADREDARCTWWVYKDPSLVPDAVYHRVGRSPVRRPEPPDDRSTAPQEQP